MLFVFEDIVKLEERAVQQVLREADQKDLVLALRGAPGERQGGRAHEHVRARRGDAQGRDGDPAAAAQARHRRRPEPHRRGRAQARGGRRDRDRRRRARTRAKRLSEAAVSYDFEQLEPSEPRPRDAAARLLAQASAEAEQIREHARAEGFEAGPQRRARAGRREIASAAAALSDGRCTASRSCASRLGRGGRARRDRAGAGARRQDPRGRLPGAPGAGRRGRAGRAAADQRPAADHRARQPRRPRDRQGGDRRACTAQGSGDRALRPAVRRARAASAARSCAPARARSTRACSTQLERAREVVSHDARDRASRRRERARGSRGRCWQRRRGASARPISPGATASSAT